MMMETRLLKITKIEKIEDDIRCVYDIHMKDTPHTFFANNILVHNTDSAFFKQKDEMNIQSWVKNFNDKLLDEFIPHYNYGFKHEYALLELQYEKDLEKVYFGDSKKRYYGIERDTNKKYIRGMNIIRKDSPPFLKEKLNELSEMIVRGDFTLDHLKVLREKIETIPYTELAITKKFSKRFELYEKTQSAHLKAAKFANEILGTDIDHRDIPYMFYIVSHCEEDKKPKDRNKAICLLDEHLHFIDERKDLFEIDYEVYFDKQVLQQLMEFSHIDYVMEILNEYKKGAKNGK
jgi:DNA polymerase elongation subunit (family B)